MTPEQRKEKRDEFVNKIVDLCDATDRLYDKAFVFATTINTAAFELAVEDIQHYFRRVQGCLNTAKEIFKECSQ